MSDESCAICTGTPWQSDGFAHDLRLLSLDNAYRLDEGSDRLVLNPETGSYEILTCKECRGEFIEMLWAWAKGTELFERNVTPGDGKSIPVRRAGRTVMITRQEWDATHE
jgi:hypothetical protein